MQSAEGCVFGVHADFQPGGGAPFGPSPIAVGGQCFTPTGRKDYSVPKEMTRDDIAAVTREHAAAARRAVDLGAPYPRLANVFAQWTVSEAWRCWPCQ